MVIFRISNQVGRAYLQVRHTESLSLVPTVNRLWIKKIQGYICCLLDILYSGIKIVWVQCEWLFRVWRFKKRHSK